MTEILSPCGGIDSLSAAIRSGADAVYFGGGDFNARRNAKNFTHEDIKTAIKYAKVRSVKVYITLNTLISDSELKEAVSYAKYCAECGADAFIVQDLGLAKLLKKHLPEIPLHASTQMTVHSPLGLQLLKEFGFSRVVISREVDKATLIKICEKAKELSLEIEAFVHGALCMSMSGQCLMSSVIGGRSGNRGMCAQPCRLPFSTSGEKGRYDLSLRDLSLISKIGEIKEIGVTSFKIEGRMKRPEYVAAATAACRFFIDNGYPDGEISEMLSAVFSRSGFTDGYYHSRLGNDMFGRRTEADIDSSSQIINKIHSLYRVERARIPLDMTFSADSNLSVTLTASDRVNTVVSTALCEKAVNRATDVSFIKDKLKKLGNTVYFAGEIKIALAEGLAVSSGVIKQLRDSVTEKLNDLRAEIKPVKFTDYESSEDCTRETETKFIARFKSIEQIPTDLSSVSAVILPVECDFSKINLPCPVYAELPRGILGTEEKVREKLLRAKPYISSAVCSNIGGAELCREENVAFITDVFMNVFNSESAAAVKDLGAEWYTASAEMTAESIRKLPDKKGFFAYGRLPLMLTRNCPNKLTVDCENCGGNGVGTDRLGNVFPISCRNGFSEIFNVKPHYLLDRIGEFSSDYAILYFTFETESEVKEILNSAKSGKKPTGEFTRGLYYRTVL